MHARSFALSVVVVLVGLAILLGAEALSAPRSVVVGGGVVVLVGVGILTTAVAVLPQPESHPEH